jgi:hypothetical protein
MAIKLFNNFKLDFAIVGAQKAGTTALYSFIKKHPKVLFGNTKELHYFDDDNLFTHNNQEVNKSNLKKLFPTGAKNMLKGDATPIYMYWDNAIERLRKHNSKLKIIVILRDPVERAFSHWKMEYYKGNDKENFYYAIKNEEERLKESQHRIFSYKSRGLYTRQLDRIYSNFPKKNILVIKHCDLKNNHEQTVQTVFNFLDIYYVQTKKEEVQPSSMVNFKSDLTMNNNEKEYLENFFKHEKNKLRSKYLINL